MSKTIDQLIEEAANEYQDVINEISGNQAPYHVEAFKGGANFVKSEMQKENEKLKSLLQKAVEALENLQGHTDAILLFPHKDKIDLFKAEQSARQALTELADFKKKMNGGEK